MKKLALIFLSTIISSNIIAQNPIVPPGVYIADPSAHVWSDGKLYVYGSRDQSPDYYCSWTHHVLSTTDLKSWTLYENRFASKGPNDQVPYSDDILYAPDCQYKNGTYYLYYCLASNKNTEGVATSFSPTGPFTNGRPIKLKGINEIDPCVFIDDDGQAYYIWGQFTAKMAKLKSNMTEIDSSTIKDNIVTEKEHFFHEGGYMVKRDGIYYFVYSHMGRAGRPTCLGYATSKSVMGPFKYGGVIIDNDHCDPGVWNNHGSIVEFKDNWYVFYHRSTHGSNTMRKACVEPFTFNADGSINEVEMTTQGASDPLNANQKIDAARACLLYGNLRVEALPANNEVLTKIKNGDVAGYKYLNFNSAPGSITIIAAPGKFPVSVDIAIDNSWGPSIGKIDIAGNGNGLKIQSYSANIKKVEGVHALWLRFYGKPGELLKINSIEFK
jgi:beta-xylosidase